MKREAEPILEIRASDDAPVEVDGGFWIVRGSSASDSEAANQLRNACLHALDRGAEHIAVDVTGISTLAPALLDVLTSADEVLRARGGTLTVWACDGDRPKLVGLGTGEERSITPIDKLHAIEGEDDA